MKYEIMQGNVFEQLPKIQTESVDLCITSPPYWGLRDYGVEGQLGAEPNMEVYLDGLMRWVKEVHRVLKPTGSFVLNLAGCYLGGGRRIKTPDGINVSGMRRVSGFSELNHYKEKQYLDVAAFAYTRIIQETSFVCRNRGTWCKPNVPSPIRSRLKQSTEAVDWYVKDADKNYWDAKPWMKPILESSKHRVKYPVNYLPAGGANIQTSRRFLYKQEAMQACGKETIEHSWRIIAGGEKQEGFELCDKGLQEHVAPYPETLISPWVVSCCPQSGVVLDPFLGSGTTMKVARDAGRSCIGIDLNPKSLAYAKRRINWANGVDGNDYYETVL